MVVVMWFYDCEKWWCWLMVWGCWLCGVMEIGVGVDGLVVS